MSTFRHGKTTKVYLGGYELTHFLRSANAPRTIDTAETTAFASTVKTYVVGQQTANLSFEGMFCYDNVGLADLSNVIETYMNLEEAVPAAVAYDSGVGEGKAIHGGLSHRTNVTVTGSVSDIVGMNIDMQLTDTAGQGRVIIGRGVDWDLDTDAEADLSALLVLEQETFEGGYAALHILDGTAIVNGTQITFEHSLDGGTSWEAPLVTWTATADKHQYFSAHFNEPIGPDVRFHVPTPGASTADALGYFIPKFQ